MLRLVEVALAFVLVGSFGVAVTQAHSYFAKSKRQAKPGPYAISSSVGRSHVAFSVTAAAPGDSGSAKVVLKNIGTRPARVTTQRLRVRSSPLDPYLRISIYDARTRHCLYPAVARRGLGKPKRGSRLLRPRPSGPCRTTGPWAAVPRTFAVPPAAAGRFVVHGPRGRQWDRGESHLLRIRWQVDAGAPNSVQARRSSFDLRWRVGR